MSAGSKQSVYGSMSDEKDGGDTPLSKRGSINFSNDESSKNSNISDMKARVNSFYEMPLTKSSSKSGAIDKEAKYEGGGGGGGSAAHTAVPPLVRKPSNMVALDRRKQYATSQNNSDISCDDTDGRGRPLSTASSCMSMKSNHSRRPSKMGKKSSMDLLDDESSSNFTTVYAESEGRSMRSSRMSLKAASQLALEGSPNIITLPYPSPVPAFISPTPHTTHKPSSYSLIKSSRSQSQIPAPSSINSSTSGIQGSKSHEIKARRNSSRGPENEVYLPTTFENVLPLQTSSRRNSYSSTLPVWPLPRTSSKSSSRRASVTGSNNGLKDSSSTESIEPVIEVDRLRDEKTYTKPHAIEKLDELLAFPLSPSTSAPVSHSSEYIMENKIALSSPEYVESIDTLSTKSSLSSYVMQQASKDCSSAASKECSPAASKECSPGAEAVVPTDVKYRESHVATSSSPIPSTTAPSTAAPTATAATAMTAAGGTVGTALLAVTAATLPVNPFALLKTRDGEEQGEVNNQGERGGGGEERATTPTTTVSNSMKDALPSTADQQQHTSETAASTLLNVTKSSSLLMEVDTDSPAQSPSVLPVRSPTQAFLMGSFEDDDDDASYSNEIETPAGALEARFYDDDEESNVDFLSIPSISPIQSPASRSTMHMTSGFVKTNNPNPIPSDLSRSLDLSEVNTVGDGSLSESSSYFKDFMSPSVASTLPSDYGNTPSARRVRTYVQCNMAADSMHDHFFCSDVQIELMTDSYYPPLSAQHCTAQLCSVLPCTTL